MIRRVLLSLEGFTEKAGDIVETYLGRELFTEEGFDLSNSLRSAISQALEEFEFFEPGDLEPSPEVDSMADWAHNHRGISYKRPNGKVIYTVTGELGQYRHGMIRGYSGPLVRRSSDEEEVPMTITELEAMTRVEG